MLYKIWALRRAHTYSLLFVHASRKTIRPVFTLFYSLKSIEKFLSLAFCILTQYIFVSCRNFFSYSYCFHRRLFHPKRVTNPCHARVTELNRDIRDCPTLNAPHCIHTVGTVHEEMNGSFVAKAIKKLMCVSVVCWNAKAISLQRDEWN